MHCLKSRNFSSRNSDASSSRLLSVLARNGLGKMVKDKGLRKLGTNLRDQTWDGTDD